LSHPKYHQKNFIETFLGNDYPLNFIFDTISTRLKKLFNNKSKKQNLENLNDEGYKDLFLIPFISKWTDKSKNIVNMLKAKLAFFSLHKLERIIKYQKDPLPLEFTKNVVYKLNCKNCAMLHILVRQKED